MSLEVQPENQTSELARNQASSVFSENKLTLMDVWRVMIKRRFVILAVTILSLAGSAFYAFRTKPVYESISRIEIKPSGSSYNGLQSLVEEQASATNGPVASKTDVLVLQSDTVLLQTAETLHLDAKALSGFQKGGNVRESASSADLTPFQRQALIGYIRGGLKVSIVPTTDMVEIRYRNHDPKLATDVVNTLVDTYIDVDLRTKYDRSMHVSEWLQKRLGDLKQEAADAQMRLADFQKQHNIVGADESSNLTMQTLGQISADLESVEADRITKEARMRQFESLDPNMAALTGDNPTLAALLTQLSDLQSQRAELSTKYAERYPKLVSLNVQIDKTQAEINNQVEFAKRQIRHEYQGALGTEQMLRKRLDAQEEAAYRLNEVVGQYAILRQDAELNRSLYDTLETTLKEAGVTAGMSATNITVVDRAQVPFMPIAPRKTLSLVLGPAGGFLIGCILAFLIDSIDDRLQTSEEVESVSTMPSLASIPHILEGQLDRKRDGADAIAPNLSKYNARLVSVRNPKSMGAEAFRILRSSLLLSSIDKPPRVIVFTSAFSGEGKTTTAMNTAITLAQRGERVLLVDADLRRGSLHRTFRLANMGFGLSTVLRQPELNRDLPVPIPELPTLHVLTTGPRPPNPAEMLSSNRMVEQLGQWAQEFDRIVLDTAPVLAVSDTQALAVLADAVVLVVRAGITRKGALIRARDLLLRINAPVIGVVVNDVDLRLENFYTYEHGMYAYHSRYRYGSPYSDEVNGSEDEGRERESNDG